jgi:lipoprotein-anchoring transpeptidase ErfK/SrfK
MSVLRLSVIASLLVGLCSCGLSPGYKVDRAAYAEASPRETKVRISIWDQKAWLLGHGDRVLVETDISTGVPGHETPAGEYSVLEKLESKQSNRYGEYVRQTSGKVVAKTWEWEGPPPDGTVRRGIAMPYWMRVTWDGVGMHVGKFPKRKCSSFGCIRVYKDAQPLIYAKTEVGTPISIHNESLQSELGIR